MAAGGDKGSERAWCLYDWGNSAFAAVCMTAVLPPYLAGLVNRELGSPAGTAMWGWAAAAGLLAGALLGPPLGAWADGRATRRRLLAVFALGGAAATAGLAIALPGSWRLAVVLYVVAATGFTGANVFYDALLPGLGPPQRWDAISSRGYAWGYAGGGLVLAGAAALVLTSGEAGVRLSFVVVALWWAVFTIPVVTRVAEPAPVAGGGSWARLRRTFGEARQRPELWSFLLAYWVYNDGIGTMIKMSAAYGAEVGVPLKHMLGALLVTQFVGVPATIAFGRLGTRLGPRRGIELALAGYLLVACLGFFMRHAWQFWVLAAHGRPRPGRCAGAVALALRAAGAGRAGGRVLLVLRRVRADGGSRRSRPVLAGCHDHRLGSGRDRRGRRVLRGRRLAPEKVSGSRECH